jgi:Flp pilus assembly protein TadD
MMKSKLLLAILPAALLLLTNDLVSQEIPTDSSHLPKMIGGRSDNPKIDAVTVTGKVTLDGLGPSDPRPVIYVAAFCYGRFVSRRQTASDGSYTLDDVPRVGSTVVVEIEGSEAANYQVIPTPASVIYQDFSVNWSRVRDFKMKAGVVSTKYMYVRSDENQRLFDKAISAMAEKKNGKAISLFLEIVTTDPKDFVSLTQLGNLYFLDQKYADAEHSYLKAIEQRPDYIMALINLGKLYLIKKEIDNAIESLIRAVNIEPTSADNQQMLGEAYLMAKKGSKAVIYLNEAIRLAPIEKADVHLSLAALYDAAGLRDKASIEYKLYIEKVPNAKDKDRLERYIKENSKKN